MKRQRFLRPAVLRAALSAALCATMITVPAGAQTIARTVAIAPTSDGLGGFSAHFGDAFTAVDSGSAFTDLFTFAVTDRFDAAASLTSSYLDSPGIKDLQITGLSLYRYDPDTLAVIGNAIAGIDYTGVGQNPIDSWAVSGYELASGAYAIRVDGRVVGAAGGSFGADLGVSLAPIPEAPAYAMLLAGLTAGALLSRRRPAEARRCTPCGAC